MRGLKSVAALCVGLTFLTAYSSHASWFGGDSDKFDGGFVAGDEPTAVRAGQQILAQGGTAADAATALYFALSVSYPIAAGLGGGGICIVHDPARGADEVFDFLPRTVASGGAFALPGNVRGFSALQAAYGKFLWRRLIAPAEEFAAVGFPVSRSLSTRLNSSLNVVRLDANLAAEFLDESGQLKPAGAVVSNRDLALTLSAIRERGPEAFYRGDAASKIVGYAAAQSSVIDAGELAGYAVNRGGTHALKLGDAVAQLPPMRLDAGNFEASLIALLADHEGNPLDDPAKAVPAAMTNALQVLGVTTLPHDLGSTGFTVVDGNGQAVSCAVTMDGPFGAGQTAPGTGVTMAKAPVVKQDGSKQDALALMFLAPMIVTDTSGSLLLAGSGAGGPNGVAALGFTLLTLARSDAQANPGGVHATGMAPYDTVNVVTCGGGHCAPFTDPGGLSATALVQ